MRHLPLFVMLILFAFGPPAGASQLSTPGPEGLPQEPAPFGLATLRLPNSEEKIETAFAALPQSVAGIPQSGQIETADRIQVPYGIEVPASGHRMVLSAIAFERSDFFPPDFTAGDYVAMVLATDDAESTVGARDGDLAWVRAEVSVGIGDKPGTPEVIATLYTLAWGDIDGRWLFTAIADSPERLEALVSAFVAILGGAPATPAPRAGPVAVERIVVTPACRKCLLRESATRRSLW